MKNTLLLALGVLSLSTLGACANTAANRELDQKLNAETAPASTAALREDVRAMIQSSTTLTAEEKAKLLALGDSVRTESNELREESLKLRSLLIKEVMGEPYNKNEVALIKKRLKVNSEKQLNVLSTAVEKANQILGHNVDKERIMGAYFGRHADFERSSPSR